MCMSSLYQLELWLKDSEEQTDQDKTVGMVMFICMLVWPAFTQRLLKRKRDVLEKQEIRDTIGNLYTGIKLNPRHYKDAIFYYPVFLFRRIIFVAIPTFLYLWPFG